MPMCRQEDHFILTSLMTQRFECSEDEHQGSNVHDATSHDTREGFSLEATRTVGPRLEIEGRLT